MLLKKKNIVINIPDRNKAEIERHIKELGYNVYKESNVYEKPKRRRNML